MIRRLQYRSFCAVIASFTTMALFCCHALAQDGAVETVETSADGVARLLKLPFFPNEIALNPAGTRACFLRRNQSGGSDVAIVDLSKTTIIVERSVTVAADVVGMADNYLCLADSGSKALAVFDVDTLESQSQHTVTRTVHPLTVVADRFVVTNERERLALPGLEPVTDEFRVVTGQPLGFRPPRRVEAGWCFDGFVFDSELNRPRWFLGNPQIRGAVAGFLVSGDASSPSPRPLATMGMLGMQRATTLRRWDDELAIPANFRFADSLGPELPHNPGWMRWQLVTPASDRSDKLEVNRLLASIRVELPPDLDVRQVRNSVRVLVAGRRQLAQVGEFLFVFELTEERFRQLPLVPHVLLDSAPIVIPADSPTEWPIRLSNGRPLERVDVRKGPVSLDRAAQTLRIAPAAWISAQSVDDLLALVESGTRTSPTTSWEEMVADMAASRSVTRARLESWSGVPFRGVPLSIPVDFRAIGDDGSAADLAGCVVIDFQSDAVRLAFEQRQAKRLARLTLPAPTPADRLAILNPPAHLTAAPITLPAIPLLPGMARVILTIIASLTASTLIGALAFRLGVPMFNLMSSVRIAVPTISEAVSAFFVASLLAVAADVVMLPIVNHAAETAAGAVVALAFLMVLGSRFVATVGSLCLVLHFPVGRSMLLAFMIGGLSTIALIGLGAIITVALLLLQMGGML